MRKLVKNGLVGGVETVTLGDAQARAESGRNGIIRGGPQKLKAQRAGQPAFDSIWNFNEQPITSGELLWTVAEP